MLKIQSELPYIDLVIWNKYKIVKFCLSMCSCKKNCIMRIILQVECSITCICIISIVCLLWVKNSFYTMKENLSFSFLKGFWWIDYWVAKAKSDKNGVFLSFACCMIKMEILKIFLCQFKNIDYSERKWKSYKIENSSEKIFFLKKRRNLWIFDDWTNFSTQFAQMLNFNENRIFLREKIFLWIFFQDSNFLHRNQTFFSFKNFKLFIHIWDEITNLEVRSTLSRIFGNWNFLSREI